MDELMLKNTCLNICTPLAPVTNDDLLQVHTEKYLNILNTCPMYVSKAIDFPKLLDWCPPKYIDQYLLQPMRWQCAGTIKAAKTALQTGSAINLGGGFHHSRQGMGWGGCLYADIPLAVCKVHDENPGLRVAIIDLDAHKGDGLEEYIYKQTENVWLFDMYNRNEFPFEPTDLQEFRLAYPEKTLNIERHPLDGGHLTQTVLGRNNWFGFKVSAFDPFCLTEYPVDRRVGDDQYLDCLRSNLPQFLDRIEPDLVFYNAGTDPYVLDPWGCMAVTREGIFTRDQYVWNLVRSRKVPIAMTLSGGYSPDNVELVSTSISQLLAL